MPQRRQPRAKRSRGRPRRSLPLADPGLGTKLRELRLARGLTQAELARDEFSAGFISLVETGRSRISLRAASVFARRLGVEITELVGPADDDRDMEFMLLRAERELQEGHPMLAAEIASVWSKKADGVLKARFERLAARALIETTRSSEAVRLLDSALRVFRAAGATAETARTLFDLARAHARLGLVGEGLSLALQAESALERHDLVDSVLELDLHQFIAAMYHALGDAGSAEIRATRARALAEDVVADPRLLAKLYQSLALTRYEAGDKEAALAYARKAAEILQTLGRAETVAESWNTIGWLYVQREQFPKAEEAFNKAEAIARTGHTERVLPWLAANRAALALAQGEALRARGLAEALLDATPESSSRLRARTLLLRARALAALDVPIDELRAAFEGAISAHGSEPAYTRARAHQIYAEVLSARAMSTDAYAEARRALELTGTRI